MKLGIVINSNDPETVWNAFRLGNHALKAGDEVKAFLLGKGVEAESLNMDRFKVTEQMVTFAEGGGRILACGTCLHLHRLEGSYLCPVATLRDLYNIVKESDKIITF